MALVFRNQNQSAIFIVVDSDPEPFDSMYGLWFCITTGYYLTAIVCSIFLIRSDWQKSILKNQQQQKEKEEWKADWNQVAVEVLRI